MNIKQKSTLLILTVMLLVCCGHSIVYADTISGPHWHDTSTTRSIAENSPAGTNIGAAVTAHDFATFGRYRLEGTDAASFSLGSPLLDGRIISAQLKVKNSLNFEAKKSYSVTIYVDTAIREVTGSPPSLQTVGFDEKDSITVTINVTNVNEAPTFPSTTPTTLEIAENTATNQRIGSVVIGATDPDLTTTNTDSNPNTSTDDDLIYILKGDNADAFGINHNNGLLLTKDPLDYEKQKSYTLTVEVADGVLNSQGRLTNTIDITINVTNVNEAPTFDSATTTREVSENLDPITNIGDPVTATGFDTAKFDRYILEGDDAASFTLDSETGQLTTTATLDREEKSSYEVIVTVQRGIEQTGGEIEYPEDVDQNSTTVTIEVANVPFAILDANGQVINSVTLSIPENVPVNTLVGEPFSIQDYDGPGGTGGFTSAPGDALSSEDWRSFRKPIFANGTMQLRTTIRVDGFSYEPPDFEAKSRYRFRVRLTSRQDGTGETINNFLVIVNIEDVNEYKPAFTEGESASRDIVENAPVGTAIGEPVAAIDMDTADTITYTLGGTDAASFDINSETGQLLTKFPLDYEVKTEYAVTVIASDGEFNDTISVTINVIDLVPTFTEDDPTTRSIAENTARGTNIGDPVTATGPDIGYTLTYSLGGTDDAPNDYESFDIDSTNGQLITKAALNYEVKSSYEVIVIVSDGNHPSDTIIVTINVTNQTEGTVPEFRDGGSTTRSITENDPAHTLIGHPVEAIYLPAGFWYAIGGTDSGTFNIDSNNGQLTNKWPLNYESKSSYSVTISLHVSNGLPNHFNWPVEDTITVTINVTNVNEVPAFADRRTVRSIPENIAANQNIGTALTATDPDITSSNTDANPETSDVDALTYSLGGTDAESFDINSATGQLTTKTGVTFNAATKDRYDVTVTVSDSEFTDTIDVIININAMPTVIIDAPTEVQNGAFDVMITFSEAVDGFTADDITFTLDLTKGTGTASATLQSGSDGDTVYTVKITPPDDVEGTVTINVAAGGATNTENTGNAVSPPSTVVLDTLRPSITVTGVPSTATGPFSALFTFSEPVTGFTADDLHGVTATVMGIGSDAEYIAEYIVTFTPTTTRFIFVVNPNVATDAAGNGNTRLSGAPSSTITFGSPTVTITAPTTTQTGLFDVTITFSENVTGFEASDISLKKSGMTEDFDATATNLIGGPRVYTAPIVPTKNGDIDISVPASSAEDNASNGNTVSGTQTVTVELSGPAVTITGVPTTPQNSAFDVTIEFNKAVTGFLRSEISLGDGVSATVTNMTRSDATYTATITPAANVVETIMLSVPAGAAISTASEDNVASSVYPIQLDTVHPTVNITAPTDTQTGVFEITITFSEAVTDFEQTDISLTGSTATATVTDFTAVSSTEYKAEITPTVQGNVLISVPADAAEDNATNGNTVSDTLTVAVDLNDTPVFVEEDPTREVAAIVSVVGSIGDPVTATDPDITDTNTDANPETADVDTLTYLLGGRDAEAFSIDSETGQLKTLVRAYHTQSDYQVIVTVSDGTLIGTITVNIAVGMTAVCDRTPQVRDAIVAAVPGVTDCANVTETHLAAITSLNLANKSITGLTTGDFEGLTALTTLNLSNNQLTTLPAGLFDEPTALTMLLLDNNDLTALPAEVFDKLINLTALTLNNNDFSMLPAGVFDKLTSLTALNLNDNLELTGFPESVFDKLTALQTLNLSNNEKISRLPAGVFNKLTALTTLNLNSNNFSTLPAGVFDKLIALTTLNLHSNDINTLSASVFDELTNLTALTLHDNDISTLPAEVFDGSTALTTLTLHDNKISRLPAGVFEGLTALTSLTLNDNTVDPLPLTVSLKQDGSGKFKATVHTGAPYAIVLPITVTNGTIDNSATTITIPIGSVESSSLTVTRTTGTTAAVTADIGTLPGLPENHQGYALSKSSDEPLTVISEKVNSAPEFTDGDDTTRSVAENTAAGENIGDAVAATDDDTTDTLTYTLGGTDASSFAIVGTSGQLQTSAALDYETKTSYSVTVSVSDSNGGTDSIAVTINVTNVNEAPTFPDSTDTTLEVTNHTPVGTNIDDPVAATDPDGTTDVNPDDANVDALTYSLGGTDAASFDIDSDTGQLKTKDGVTFDRATKSSYTVTVTASDGEFMDSTSVDINVVVTPVCDRTPAVRDAIVAEVPGVTDCANVTETHLAAITTSLSLFSQNITALKAGDFDGLTALTELYLDNNSLTTLPNAVFDELTALTTLYLHNNQLNTLDEDVFDELTALTTLYLSGNQLTTLHEDVFETLVNLTELNLSKNPLTTLDEDIFDDLTELITLFLSNLNSTDPLVLSTSLPEDVFDGLTKLTALFLTNSKLTALPENIFEDLQSLEWLYLNENKLTTLHENVFDDLGSLKWLYLNENPELSALPEGVFEEPTELLELHLNTNTKLTTLHENVFKGLTKLTTLNLHRNNLTALPEDLFEGLTNLTTLSLSNNKLTTLPEDVFDGLTLLYRLGLNHNMLSMLPDGVFEGLTSLTQLFLHNNTVNPLPLTVSLKQVASGEFKATVHTGAPYAIVLPITVTNGTLDNSATTITIPIGDIESSSLTVTRTTGTTAAVTVDIGTLPNVPANHQGYALRKSSGLPLKVISDTSNNAPEFTDGDDTTRDVVENTAAGTDFGEPVAATDDDTADTLTYRLNGTDADSFDIDSSSGQLKTKAPLNRETKNEYSVTVVVTDGNGGIDSIAVTINVTETNNAPEFTDGDDTTREVAENTAAGENIGDAVAATDDDTTDTLTYTLGGTDASSFAIVSTSGQLQTSAALDYEATKNSYSVTVSVSDSIDTDSIDVTINVTNVNEAPTFPATTDTRSIAENTATATNIGSAVTATDPDVTSTNTDVNPEDANVDTLTYSLSGTTDAPNDHEAFDIDTGTGQLKTKAALDHETKDSYSVKVTASDGGTDTASVTVTISVTDVNDVPEFTDGTQTTRSVAENTAAGTNIGAAVAATDEDGDTLEYTLGGTDAGSFDIVSTSGQLKTKSALDRETKSSYSVTVSVSDSNGGSDSIDVTINVTDANDAPEFTDGTQTTRSVAENTAAGENIGSAVAATDEDGDTLEYTLGGTDAGSFDIVSTSGQLKTKAALDRETKSSYSVTVSVSDSNGGSDSIDVTINITDVNDAPTFASETATRSIPENTAAGTNIGAAVAATDEDGDTLSYTLDTTGDATFDIDNSTGQLKTEAALDFETLPNSYTVTVTATDSGNLTDTIAVTISVTDANDAPAFANQTETRSIPENTAAGTNIGAAVTATDEDGDILSYTLDTTGDATFDIVSTSGQLKTEAALDFETKSRYEVTVTVSDGNNGTASISVTIDLIDENDAPEFINGDRTVREVHENTPIGTNIDVPVAATDQDGDSLAYTLGGTDAASFSIDSATGQLKIKVELDYETKPSYSVTVSVSDNNGGTDTIAVTISITNLLDGVDAILEAFQDGVVKDIYTGPFELSISFNRPVTGFERSDLKVRQLGREVASDVITGWSGPHLNVGLGYTDYKATITPINDDNLTFHIPAGAAHAVDDGQPCFDIKYLVQIDLDDEYKATLQSNQPPEFAQNSTTRSVPENTPAGTNIGSAVSATDQNGDILSYTLSGTNGASFSIVSATGQLKTRASLDYETKNEYYVIVTVSDGRGGTDTINVTINVTDVNETLPNQPPEFAQNSTTRSVPENTPTGINFGAPVTATDPDSGDTLSYTLSGTNGASFSIVSTTGQLKTRASLDYETKNEYYVIVTVSDGKGGTDTINVTINVTDVDETLPNQPPAFATENTTRSIGETTMQGVKIGEPVSATDPNGDTLTYSLEGTDAASFSIDTDTGQLKTKVALNRGTKSQYTVTVKVSDGEGATDTITVTINILKPDRPEPLMYVSQNGVEEWDQTVKPGTFQLGMLFDQPVTGFEQSDLGVSGFGTNPIITNWQRSTDGKDYTATVRVQNTGSVTFTVPASVAQAADDGQGNVRVKFLVIITEDGEFAAPAGGEEVPLPNETLLLPNYPNPSNPETWIPYRLAKDSDVTIKIYTVDGRLMRRLEFGHQAAGIYQNRSRAGYWDGKNEFGEVVASGIYFYVFKAGEYTALRKMLILK